MRILIDGQTLETEEYHRGIGTYMRNVLPRLLKFSLTHQYFIILSDRKVLDRIDEWTKNRLQVVIAREAAPGIDYAREGEYTATLQKVIDQYQIDLVWNPNPLMNNVLFPDRPLTCKMFVTVHDLIPLLMPVKEWPDQMTAEYHRRLKMIREDPNICLLFDSESSRRDWTANMNDRTTPMLVTPLSADSRKFYRARGKKISSRPYILFTGGFDYRKNIDGAIDAFQLARKLHGEDRDFLRYRLIIVGSCTDQIREKYEQLVEEKGLGPYVEFTGFVSEEKLIRLYQGADLFFFPSK